VILLAFYRVMRLAGAGPVNLVAVDAIGRPKKL
jgi:hypothetical protein